MKKKIGSIALLIMIMAVFALPGCGKGGGESNENGESGTESQDVTASYAPLRSFTTEDLEGNTVTQDIFAGKDVTMINIWGTFCGPCIEEMPGLQKLSEALPDNAQIVGFVMDVSIENKDSLQDARDIVSELGVTFENIIVSDDLKDVGYVSPYVPTTIFVDSEGNAFGRLVVGADINHYVSELESLLEGWKYED